MAYQVPEPKIFACRQSQVLGEKIAQSYGAKLGNVIFSEYADGEFQPSYEESIRGARIFIIGSTNPSSRNLMEMLLMIDAAKRASARHITAVMPYFGWARQDRKDKPRVPIAAKLIAKMLESAGATRIITMDLHADQIQGFFDIPVDNAYSTPAMLEDIQNKNLKKVMVVSPDVGGVVRARALTKYIPGSDLAIIDKRRPEAGVSEVMNIIGEVDGRHCVMVDDIVDSGGTLCNAAKALMDAGALSVDAYVTHGVLSGGAVSRIASSPLSSLITTDSIQATEAMRVARNIRQISIAPLLGEAIMRINKEKSVSSLFQ